MPKKPTTKARKAAAKPRVAPSKQFVLDWLKANPEVTQRELCRRARLAEQTLVKAFKPDSIGNDFITASLQAFAKAMGVTVGEMLGQPQTTIAEQAAPASDDNSAYIPHHCIHPSPNNPRKHFDPEQLRDLADSLARHGQLQNIVVRPRDDMPGHYWLIAGERRWRAFGLLIADENTEWNERIMDGTAALVHRIPTSEWTLRAKVIRNATEREAYVMALVENDKRSDLTPLEQGGAYHAMTELGMSVQEIADEIRRVPEYVSQRIGLVENLCDHAKAWLQDDVLNFTQARILSQFSHAEQMLLLRAMDNKDQALTKGNNDEFRARAKYLVELHRNGGVHTKPVEVHRIAEAERDETLGFDHQAEKLREQNPPTGEQDNTRFVPPAAPQPDAATVAAATQAFDADDEGGDAAPDDTGDAEANASATSSVREDLNGLQAEYNAWLDRLYAFEDTMRQAAANRPEIGFRLLMLSILNCLEVPDLLLLGRGQHCLPGRACFSGLEFDTDPDNADWPLAMAQQRYTAGLWHEVGAASYQPAITMALASLINLPGDWENYRSGVDRQTLGFWQAVAMDLGIAWPDDLYTAADGTDDDTESGGNP